MVINHPIVIPTTHYLTAVFLDAAQQIAEQQHQSQQHVDSGCALELVMTICSLSCQLT